ncbi:hypothetical protein SAMN05444487_102226 [Marininema mesophilum]|uniref:Uncharacterized protein n=1 Tax=Marininema mesophilum TaxID=1048340 RepID=A0A1H2SIF0_9BACL|nr:hypothetical protein SAMN05444487_102226 [Marininema mesophilum]
MENEGFGQLNFALLKSILSAFVMKDRPVRFVPPKNKESTSSLKRGTFFSYRTSGSYMNRNWLKI